MPSCFSRMSSPQHPVCIGVTDKTTAIIVFAEEPFGSIEWRRSVRTARTSVHESFRSFGAFWHSFGCKAGRNATAVEEFGGTARTFAFPPSSGAAKVPSACDCLPGVHL